MEAIYSRFLIQFLYLKGGSSLLTFLSIQYLFNYIQIQIVLESFARYISEYFRVSRSAQHLNNVMPARYSKLLNLTVTWCSTDPVGYGVKILHLLLYNTA